MVTMTNSVMRIGGGIDTARYWHRVNYLRDDRQLAAKPVTITEDRDGYDRLQNDLQLLHRRHPEATLHVHIDAAGQYAANLERFLRTMELPIIVSVGEPKRNKDYHAAISPKRTTDNTESLAMARFALVEQPPTYLISGGLCRICHSSMRHSILYRLFTSGHVVNRDSNRSLVYRPLPRKNLASSRPTPLDFYRYIYPDLCSALSDSKSIATNVYVVFLVFVAAYVLNGDMSDFILF